MNKCQQDTMHKYFLSSCCVQRTLLEMQKQCSWSQGPFDFGMEIKISPIKIIQYIAFWFPYLQVCLSIRSTPGTRLISLKQHSNQLKLISFKLKIIRVLISSGIFFAHIDSPKSSFWHSRKDGRSLMKPFSTFSWWLSLAFVLSFPVLVCNWCMYLLSRLWAP